VPGDQMPGNQAPEDQTPGDQAPEVQAPEVQAGGDGMQPDSAQLAHLRAENARLQARLRHAEASAASQAMRADGWSWQAEARAKQMVIMRASLFWRLTLPLRLAVVLARGLPATSNEGRAIRLALEILRRDGIAAAVAAWRLWRKRQLRGGMAVAAEVALPAPVVGEAPALSMAPSVLIVAELSVAQCAKYRVWQKQEHFGRLGVASRVVNWRNTEDCYSAAATATQAIFYRVPATPEMLALMAHLRRLGVPFAWEVDDLIFDQALYRQNSNLADLDTALQKNLLDGVMLYREALLACGRGIASTAELAQAMREAGVADVAVVENALDDETLALAGTIRGSHVPHDGILVTYGSGTKTHDTDFRQASAALLRLLRARPEVRLRVIGELNLPAEFEAVATRVERLGPMPYARYLTLLGESDINLAPLEPGVFNDAKSNIKFLEAAILGVPSVCSPRAQFAAVVRDGESGFLADDEAAWFAALEALAGDAGLRRRLGETAMQDAVRRYAPDAVARDQVAPLLAPAPSRAPGRLRVLMANVFYAPRSYGGATIVVEEMVRRLKAMPDTDIAVVTSLGQDVSLQVPTRTMQDGVTVFALPTHDGDMIAAYDDPGNGDAFGHILDALRPDIVHLHSVQSLSASLATACRDRGVPYVITLHDPWWLCVRQFMVREDGNYCFQKRIDLHVCEACVPGVRHVRQRLRLLRDALDGAALLLSPSAAHRELYLAQGIAPERIVVAPNGVRLPSGPALRTKSSRLRFGYVGGNEKVKGYRQVKAAFAALDRNDWDLILVDNTLNLGFSSIDEEDWRLQGTVRIVPAYGQDTMEAFFAGIDVLLFPSQWKESFGLTVREALARDVWVIATEGGGPADAIVDGVNGTLIPLDGRHEKLQAAIQGLLDAPGRLADYRNPHKQDIIGYDTQAVLLRALLERVAAEAA
jgi:glycosyltransferase involved in cell wall biosynthesis